MTSDGIKAKLKGRVAKAGSLRALAKELHLSAAYLSDILRNRREISSEVAEKLGYRKVIKTTITFVRMENDSD